MKKYITLLALAFPLFLASCNKAEISEAGNILPPDETGQVPILFTTDSFDVSVSTKATAVTALPSFKVSATTGTSGSETQKWNSINFSGTSTYSGGKYWPVTDQKYHFYAANADITFVATGCTVAPADASTDVVVAYLESPSYKASNKLTFNHIYSRIGKLTLNAPSGCTLSNVTWTLSAPVGGTYNIRTNTWTPGTAAAQTLAAGTSSTNDVYVVPGTYTLTCKYTITKGDYSESQTKTASVALTQGKINNITGTAVDGSTAIAFTISVTAWAEDAKTITWK